MRCEHIIGRCVVQVDHAGITKNYVVAELGGKKVAFGTAKNNIEAIAAVDFVDAANRIIDCFDLRNCPRTISSDVTSVTKNDIVACACSDRVTKGAANDNASSNAAASNRVNTTDR